MMKLIHCADLHLDSPMETNLSPEKARERKREILSAFAELVRHAAQSGVSAILIAGDLFDSTRISKKVKSYVLETVASHPNLTFFYLVGNHDRGGLASVGDPLPKNLYTFGDGWQSYTLGEVTVTGSERPDADTLTLSEDACNIVLLHGQERAGRGTAGEDIIPLGKLKNKHIDYLALGHLHDFREAKLDARGVACYSGCLEGRGFDECGKKGFVLLEVENRRVHHTFVPFSKRELHTVECDITGFSSQLDLEDRLLEAVEGISSHHLVKAVLVGSCPIDMQKDVAHLEQVLSDRFYFAKLRDASRVVIDPEVYQNDISLKGEFVRRVMASGLKQEEKERVIACGFRVLSGEEVEL